MIFIRAMATFCFNMNQNGHVQFSIYENATNNLLRRDFLVFAWEFHMQKDKFHLRISWRVCSWKFHLRMKPICRKVVKHLAYIFRLFLPQQNSIKYNFYILHHIESIRFYITRISSCFQRSEKGEKRRLDSHNIQMTTDDVWRLNFHLYTSVTSRGHVAVCGCHICSLSTLR